jgi:hypothetical protein
MAFETGGCDCVYRHVPFFVKIGQQIGVSPKQIVIANSTAGMWHSNLVCIEVQTVDTEKVTTITSSHVT